MDLKTLCRTCMSNRTKVSSGMDTKKLRRSIYKTLPGWSEGPTILTLLRAVQPEIQIHAKDKLPKIMCPGCIEKLRMTYEFIEMCKDTDKKFRKILNESNDMGRAGKYDATSSGLVDPVLGIILDEPNVKKTDQNPEFEEMFINNWSAEEDHPMESDDSSDNTADEDESSKSFNWSMMEARDTKPNRKRIKKTRRETSESKVAKQCHENKIDEFSIPAPNLDGSINCRECNEVINNVSLWNDHMMTHSLSRGPTKIGGYEKDVEEANERIKTLTEEVLALRTEMNQIRPIGSEFDTSLLPPLPLYTLDSLENLDARMTSEIDLRNQMINLIHRIGGKDYANFVRLAIKAVISDDLAVHLTWRGTPDKPSIQRFGILTIIKDICRTKYRDSAELDINKVCQQHVVHAKDRVDKRKKKVTP